LIHALSLLPAALLAVEPAPGAPAGVDAQLWHWVAFGVFVTVVLVLDLFVFHRHSKETTLREAAFWTVIWCSLALVFNGIIYVWDGQASAVLFLTGYVVEWSLSMDNVFVFAVIFSFFRVPKKYQYRVLFWGILGAIFMRLTFILAGKALIDAFEWVMPIFGGFLIYTGIKLAFHSESDVHPENNILMRLAKKVFPVAKGDHGQKFFVREGGKLCITPLLLVLLVVESTDVLFAVDSVPAIFGITDDPFIVFTSNIFAILGLRALYFLLAGVIDMFRYLRFGLSAVLTFVGLKMVLDYFAHIQAVQAWLPGFLVERLAEHNGQKGHLIQPLESLLVILSLLGISILASIIAAKLDKGHSPVEDLPPTPPDSAPAARVPPEVEAAELERK